MDKVIINGVDVSKCNAYKDKHCLDKTSIMFTEYNLCSNFSDCYFKQLKRLEQENENLKFELKSEQKDNKYIKNCCIRAGKELEKCSFKWDGKEKNLVVQALELNEQYDKLQAENERLKEEINRNGREWKNHCNAQYWQMQSIIDKYSQALQEIREYCEEQNLKADYTACEIIDKINEVIGAE